MPCTALEGKVVWVSGATGALGAEICRQLAAAGASPVASSRSEDKLSALQTDIQPIGEISIIPVDIKQEATIRAVADEIVLRHGRIDALVNSTSISLFADFLDLDDEAWRDILDSKLMAYVRTCRAVIPHMIEQGGGSIINISGRSARQPLPTHLPGGCANAAVNLLTKGLADRYYNDNIRVNCVAPGPIESKRFSTIKSSHEKNESATGARPVLTRDIGQPLDIADAVLWLLSDRSKHLTGTVIPVDGGSTVCV
ncbi:SDR family NAD(P)-dependent oxidoreductase [Allopusillimonas soli]|uniref:SDR family oxidoreductase n=1 Tax=Allopusillimonas soli TaxID=659016 RepID=A0A853FAZ0_9BURK|nr:SDR family oxidoreductase [Allopusillimonas soli]NYT36090.1 SDR family oxidoreductase [Allopusillimonas soli]